MKRKPFKRWSQKWLASEWRGAWKWLSVQLGFITFLAPTLYENLDAIQDILPRKLFAIAQAGLGILVMANAVKKKA